MLSGCSCEIYTLSHLLSCVSLKGQENISVWTTGSCKATDPGACDSISVRITKLCFNRVTHRTYRVPSIPRWLLPSCWCPCVGIKCLFHREKVLKFFWYQKLPSGWLASSALELKLSCFIAHVSMLSLTWKHNGSIGVLKICTQKDILTSSFYYRLRRV